MTNHAKHFGTLLTRLGFAPHGRRFTRALDPDFVQVVGLQSRSDPRERLYTVNLGVWSRLLASFFDEFHTEVRFIQPARDAHAPDAVDCHWRQRLGFLTDAPDDLWWPIDGTSHTERALELLAKYGIPKLEALSTADRLEQSFLAGETEQSRSQELAFASVLVASRGWSTEVEGLLTELRRTIRPTPPWQRLADMHEQALRKWAATRTA